MAISGVVYLLSDAEQVVMFNDKGTVLFRGDITDPVEDILQALRYRVREKPVAQVNAETEAEFASQIRNREI